MTLPQVHLPAYSCPLWRSRCAQVGAELAEGKDMAPVFLYSDQNGKTAGQILYTGAMDRASIVS